MQIAQRCLIAGSAEPAGQSPLTYLVSVVRIGIGIVYNQRIRRLSTYSNRYVSLPMFRVSLAVLFCSVVFGGTIVVPNAQTNSPGNLQNGGPPVPVPGVSQMLYSSSQFAGPISITDISFRAVAGSGPVGIDYGNVSVYLSTSPKSPDGGSANRASETFADNLGPDFTLVFSGNSIILNSPGCSGPGVCPFDLTNHLTKPFLYNPANGNLLLEVVSTGFRDVLGTSAIEAMQFGPTGGLISEVAAFGSTTATTGTFFPRGLIAQFAFSDVPEPASLVMTGLGLSALLWTKLRRRSGPRA